MAQTYAIACYRQESVDSNMKLPKLTCVAAVLMLLLSMGFTATAQQKDPWKSKLCKEQVVSQFCAHTAAAPGHRADRRQYCNITSTGNPCRPLRG